MLNSLINCVGVAKVAVFIIVNFFIVHRLKKSYNGVLFRVSFRKIKETFVAQRSMLALKCCFIDPAQVSAILLFVCFNFNLWCFILLLFCRMLPTGFTGFCSRVAEASLEPGEYPSALGTAFVIPYPGSTVVSTGVIRAMDTASVDHVICEAGRETYDFTEELHRILSWDISPVPAQAPRYCSHSVPSAYCLGQVLPIYILWYIYYCVILLVSLRTFINRF